MKLYPTNLLRKLGDFLDVLLWWLIVMMPHYHSIIKPVFITVSDALTAQALDMVKGSADAELV